MSREAPTVCCDRAPVTIDGPHGPWRSARLILTAPEADVPARVLVWTRTGLQLDTEWLIGESWGLPSHGQVWSVATPDGRLRVSPVRGCTSCGGAWWRDHHPFPDQRVALGRVLAQAGGGPS